MTTRNVSFTSENIQLSNSIGSCILPSRWSNYGLAVWSHTETVMLRLELYQSWSDENYLWFKRVPRAPLVGLQRRKVGQTEWPNEAIIVEGVRIIASGPPYGSTRRWHMIWPDHQNFVEELANVITTKSPPHQPPTLPIHRGPEALVNWDRNSPIAVSFQIGEAEISDEWMGGLGMLYAYPGGPSRRKS